jgi:hypothetical protein
MNFKKIGPRYGESPDGRYSICNAGSAYTAATRAPGGWSLLGSRKYRQGDEIGRSEAYAACVSMCDQHQQENEHV